MAGVGGPAGIRVRVGMADFFHTPVGACRDDAHAPAISRPRSQKTAMMMITPIVFPPCIGDSRSLCRSFHMHHVRYRYGGDCEGVWRVEPVFLFRFRTSLDGRHEGRRDMRSAKGGKKRPEQVRETLVWVSVVLFRPSVGWYRMFGYVRDAVSLA